MKIYVRIPCLKWKIWKLLAKYKTVVLTALKHKLTPYHSKPPHLYGLPKIHKSNIPLRPTVSSIGSPCYALADILGLLGCNTDSFVKNSEHFIKLIQEINLQNDDYLISFDTVSLVTNVPTEEVLQVTTNRLNKDPSFPECSTLQIENIMELLDICSTTTYFQFEDILYQLKEGMVMKKSLSLVVSDIFMEHS
jgi:hypothetical protein